ncbi:MAG: HlyC/CorC family transporter [Alphaproteobacteria bacterium]|nr:HlyC/CorC family transporter [Alphaproteobacteria bacterium]
MQTLGLRKFLGFRRHMKNMDLRKKIQHLVESDKDASLLREERIMLVNVLTLSRVRLANIMVPRAEIDALEEQEEFSDVVESFRASGHSRMPLYQRSLDNPIGLIHVKDLIGLEVPEDETAFQLSRYRREILFVPPSMSALDLLNKMQVTRIHMALVIDEYGGTDGLVTLEDLVEQIVGEIEDEHDAHDDKMIVKHGSQSYLADARTELDEFEQFSGITLDAEMKDEVDTLGGLVFSLTGRVPVRGEIIPVVDAGFEIVVEDADPRRIKRVRVNKIDPDQREKSH